MDPEPTVVDQEGNLIQPDRRQMRLPPARTQRRRVQQLVVQAQDLVEERMQQRVASPTEIVAILRFGAEAELANIERIKAQTELAKAQRAKAEAEVLDSQMFKDAMDAIAEYRPPS